MLYHVLLQFPQGNISKLKKYEGKRKLSSLSNGERISSIFFNGNEHLVDALNKFIRQR